MIDDVTIDRVIQKIRKLQAEVAHLQRENEELKARLERHFSEEGES